MKNRQVLIKSLNSKQSKHVNLNAQSIINLEETEFNENFYSTLLLHPVKILRLIGLYHHKNDNFILKSYPLTILLIFWLNFFKSFSYFSFYDEKSDESRIEHFSKFVLKLAFTIWTFICTINGTFLFIIHEYKHMYIDSIHEFTNLVFNLYPSFYYQWRRIERLKLKIIFTFWFLLFFALANCSTVIISLFGPKYYYPAFMLSLTPLHKKPWIHDQFLLKLTATLVMCMLSLHWTMMIAYFTLHCFIICYFLDIFNENFKKFTRNCVLVSSGQKARKYTKLNIFENIYSNQAKKLNMSEKEFDFFKLWHSKLALLVRLLDKCFKNFMAITLIAYSIIILLMLSILSNSRGSCLIGMLQIMFPFWILVSLFIVGFVVIPSAMINSKVMLMI
jgi:hypothetical protein